MAAPLDLVSAAIDLARVRLNDAIASINGEVLTNTAVFTQTLVNGAFRKLQEALAELDFPLLDQETIITNVPICLVTTPGVFMYIGWDGCYNGSAVVATPVLPADFIAPQTLWERSATVPKFREMDRCDEGLPSVTKGALNKLYDWRGQAIYFPGATVLTDIRMRYRAFFPDFATTTIGGTTTQWYDKTFPIVRALNPFAWLICKEMAAARGDVDASAFEEEAQKAIQQMIKRDGGNV